MPIIESSVLVNQLGLLHTPSPLPPVSIRSFLEYIYNNNNNNNNNNHNNNNNNNNNDNNNNSNNKN